MRLTEFNDRAETKSRATKITPKLVVKDEWGFDREVAFPWWLFVLACAIRGIPWAVEEIESGKWDGHLNVGAYI